MSAAAQINCMRAAVQVQITTCVVAIARAKNNLWEYSEQIVNSLRFKQHSRARLKLKLNMQKSSIYQSTTKQFVFEQKVLLTNPRERWVTNP